MTNPLVLVPGLLCSAELFAAQLDTLWPLGPVMIASTLEGETMEGIAAAILRNAPSKFALAGVSMGGYVCMEIMRQAPDRVTRLALLSTSARPDTAEQTESRRTMAGYELPIAMDIFRGRYRESLSEAKPIAANVPLKYRFALPQVNHVFLPGHRIMVQVQSTWFPLYDRNPQTFVPNIFFAKASDYVTATQKVTVAGPDESFISLPVVRK